MFESFLSSVLFVDIALLPKILAQEDNQIINNQVEKSIDPLTNFHNNSLKTIKLVHIISELSTPMCEDLEKRLAATKSRIIELQRLKSDLKLQLLNMER